MRLGALGIEVFEVAYLDSAYRLLPDDNEGHEAVERLAEGTVDRTAVYPRRVVEAVLKRGAAAIDVFGNDTSQALDLEV